MENTAVIPDVEIKETHILLQNMLDAQESGDIELFASCFVHDNKAVNIGTDVDEFWIGWKPFFNYMKKMIQLRKGMKITAKNTSISIESKCGLAWYSQLIDTCLETKGEPFRIEGFRHTGVMKRIDNHWKIVQSHMSIAFEPEET